MFPDAGEDGLRRVCRCAELTQKAAIRVLSTATCDQSDPVAYSVNTSISEPCDLHHLALTQSPSSLVLSQDQVRELDLAADDVKLAAQTLMSVVKKKLPAPSLGTATRTKRMLPMIPATKMVVPRSKSANAQKRSEQVRRSKSVMETTQNRQA